MIDGLKDKHRDAIIEVLASNDRVERVVLFGSRAMETFTPSSDVDIALFGKELTLTDQGRLAAALEALTIPQRVDLLLHARIDNDALRAQIRRHGIEWYRRPKGTPPARPPPSPQPSRDARILAEEISARCRGLGFWQPRERAKPCR